MKTIPFISFAVAHSGQFLWRLKLFWTKADCAKTLLKDLRQSWSIPGVLGPEVMDAEWEETALCGSLLHLHACPLNFWVVMGILGIFSLKKNLVFPWISRIWCRLVHYENISLFWLSCWFPWISWFPTPPKIPGKAGKHKEGLKKKLKIRVGINLEPCVQRCLSQVLEVNGFVIFVCSVGFMNYCCSGRACLALLPLLLGMEISGERRDVMYSLISSKLCYLIRFQG